MLRQFILVLSSVELTSILVPSYKLRIMVLLISSCRATIENLSSVHSFLQWQSYLAARAMSVKFR